MNSNDIAKLAGVSRSTVSRVVNNYPNVPEETRKKVQEIIEKYGYVPNTMGRGLVGMRPPIIALFILDFFHEKDEMVLRTSPVLMEFAALASDMVKKRGYYLLVSVLQSEEEIEQIETLYRGNTIQGAILMGDTVSKERLLPLANEGCKLVIHNIFEKNFHENVVLVNNADYEMAYDAIERLIEAGHQRIAYITGDFRKLAVRQRMRGMDACLQDHGLTFDPKHLGQGAYHRTSGGYVAMQQVLKQCKGGDLPTALLANSVMAVGALRALKDVGMKVPQDMSIMAIDGIEECRYSSPPITEICVSHSLIIQTVVDNLLAMLEGKPVQPEYWLGSVGEPRGNSVRSLEK